MSTGPRLVHATLGRTPKMPSRLTPCGGTRRWESRCRRRYASGVSAGGASRSSMTVVTGSTVTPRRSSSRAASPPTGSGSASSAGCGYHASRVRPEARSIVVSPMAAALGMRVKLAGAEGEHPLRLDARVRRALAELEPGVAVDLEAVGAEGMALVQRRLVRPAVDDDRHLLAARVRGADRRVAADVAKARGVVRGAEPEVPTEEEPIDRGDSRLALGRDRGEAEQLDAGQQLREFRGRDPALVVEDATQVPAGSGVAGIDHALQRGDVLGRLVHAYSAASSAASSALSSPRS